MILRLRKTMGRYLTTAEYLIYPVGARRSRSNDVVMKTKGIKKEGKEKLNEHVGIW